MKLAESSPRVAVIGCGYWGKNLVRNVQEAGALAAVSDANPNVAARFAEQYLVPALSVEEVVASEIEALVIATPAETHGDLASAALRAGKHVFVEKPLSLSVRQAQQLTEEASRGNQTLMVGHLLQYHPVFRKLQALVASGDLGRLQYIYSNRLNLGKIRREEDVFWSFAPHDISMILSLAGEEPDHVSATGASYLHSHLADVTTTHMAFPNGIHAHVFVSWLHPFKEQKLVVVGVEGMAVFDDTLDWREKLRLYPHRVEWRNGMPEPLKAEPILVEVEQAEPLRLEIRHFLECVRNGAKPRTDGAEGTRVLRVLEKAARAAAGKSLEDASRALPQREQAVTFFSHGSAFVDAGSTIGAGTKIWHFSHVLSGCSIGEDCVVGQNVMIGPDVTIGRGCKIQNNVSIYKGVELEEGVFCGPSCVFTNVNNPRADVERKHEFRKTRVGRGATIGANATIVCGHDLGEYSFIAAGAVVTKDVRPHALMAGVPAKRIGWMSRAGERLGEDMTCPRTGEQYREIENGQLARLTIAEAGK